MVKYIQLITGTAPPGGVLICFQVSKLSPRVKTLGDTACQYVATWGWHHQLVSIYLWAMFKIPWLVNEFKKRTSDIQISNTLRTSITPVFHQAIWMTCQSRWLFVPLTPRFSSTALAGSTSRLHDEKTPDVFETIQAWLVLWNIIYIYG